MNEAELLEFLNAMKRLREANSASPHAARNFLKEEGFLTENGDIADPYAPKRPDAQSST